MVKLDLPLLGLAMVFGVAGCASGPCTGNPNTDSLGCVQRGISSGDYGRATEAKRLEAEAMQRRAAAAQEENVRLRGQIAASQAEEQALRGKIAAQRADLDRMRENVRLAADAGKLSPAEAAERNAQLDLLRRRQAELQASSGNTRELQQKAQALQSEIDALSAALARGRG